ncbi:MAG TPA: MATE family efflux transporter [Chitinophagaceae bacterium]|nr:MATE family efflux transporter [Chitinophagaceae bacterium]HQZ74440.1 MATE family efflux transporter [Chitinophagaceae bacterium]
MAGAVHNNLQVAISNRQILKIAMPISLAIFIPQLNFITNNIFLGHYSTDNYALAVAGITGVYYLIFAAIGYGLNNGLQALIARRAGENRPEEIGKLFTQGVLIGLLVAGLGILITWTITPYLFGLIIHDPEVHKKAVEFLRIRIWGLPFLYIYQLRNALLVGTNQSRYLVAGTLAETVTNIGLDYVLIFGMLGFPELGFNGAAIASVIAEFVGMFVIFLVIRWKGISQRFGLFQDLKWNKENSSLIFSMSAPLMFQHAISIISWQFFFLLTEHHGDMALKVSNVMRNIFGVFGCVTWAFAATTNAMVSNIIGQGKKEQVNSLLKKIIKLSTGVAVVVCLLLNLFPEIFLSIFGQGDDFVAAALPVLRVVSAALILMSFSIITLSAVTGSGNTRVTFFIELFAIIMYCIYVYLVSEYYFLPIKFGWMSEWLYWLCLFVPSLLYIRSGQWKKKVI